MKRLLFSILLSIGIMATSFAQTNTPTVAAATSKDSKKASGTTKSGKPDMRFKENKDAAKAANQPTVSLAPPPAVKSTPPVTPTAKPKINPTPVVAPTPNPAPSNRATVVQNKQPVKNTNSATDATIGTDAKGRTLYKGKRGGTYYINANGNKEYVKQQ